MNKFVLVIAVFLVLVAIILVIFSNVVIPSDNGRNLSTFFCGKNTQYQLTNIDLKYNGTNCSITLKDIEPHSRLYYLENGGPQSSYAELLPSYEVYLSKNCSFSENFLPQQSLVADDNLSMYICFNP